MLFLYFYANRKSGVLKFVAFHINNASFVKTFGEISGEKYKRISAQYLESSKIQPLLLNKSFYFYKKYRPELTLSSELLETLINDYSHAKEINNFLNKALKE